MPIQAISLHDNTTNIGQYIFNGNEAWCRTTFESPTSMHRPLVLSLIDQALTSGWSFGVMAALVAFTDPATVGHFALYAAALLIVIGLHGALITTPMNVMLPGEIM